MSQNYFELYQIEASFFPDEKKIRDKFYELSREFHPDHSNNAEEAVLKTSLNNAAYKTLKKFDTRLPYVLELKGEYQAEEKYALDPMFLMEMMELNEEISFASEESKPELINKVEKLEEEIHSELESYCKSWDSSKDDSLLKKIKDLYYRRKYLKRLWQNINEEDAEL